MSKRAPKFGDIYRWRPNGHLVMVINDSPISFITVAQNPDPGFTVEPSEPYFCHPTDGSSAPWTDDDWLFVDA